MSALAVTLVAAPAVQAEPSNVAVPATGASSRIDAIRQRGVLRVAVLDEFPWLKKNKSDDGEPFEGGAWLLASNYARRLGVRLETVPVGFDDKVSILATERVDMTIAPLLETPERIKAVDFISYSAAAQCLFGRADNAKLTHVRTVEDLDRADITIASIAGTPQGAWLQRRLPKAGKRAVAGNITSVASNEVVSGRADVAPIDKFFFAALARTTPDLVPVPFGSSCLSSVELPMTIGMAVAKGQPVFLTWLRAVAQLAKPEVAAEQSRVVSEDR